VDTSLVRQSLEHWLARSGAGEGCELGSLRPVANGFSAETVIVTLTLPGRGERDIVIRFEAPGGEIFPDTNLGCQARTLRVLAANRIPAPDLIGVEEDPCVLGRRFLIMERASGRTFPQTPNYNDAGWVKDLTPDLRSALWRNALTVLGRVNRLTMSDGFEFLDRPHHGRLGLEQYLNWLAAWHRVALKDEPHAVIDAAMGFLISKPPHDLPVGFVWGDSNPCNMLFNSDLSVSAILDFEAAALGPGELDLGWWFFLDRTRLAERAALPGIPDRSACINIYEEALGRRVQELAYFEILAGVRMSLVIASTATRLAEAGRLALWMDATANNPMTAALAGLLGMPRPQVGRGFREFAAAVSLRA
jgi:aminoglycoside phosphotransferase (APT) family kinase protein